METDKKFTLNRVFQCFHQYVKVGCIFVLICNTILVFITILIVFGIRFSPDQNLPPHCNTQFFIEFIDTPVDAMRVTKNLYGASRVIAIDGEENDICHFRASTHPQSGFWSQISPDGRFIAFTVNHIQSPISNTIRYIFIVDKMTGTYNYLSNSEQEFGVLSWSPDSQQLIYQIDVPSRALSQSASLGSLSPTAEHNWITSLDNFKVHFSGYIEWLNEGTSFRYGHEEDNILGKGIGHPFWCYLDDDGTNLSCELIESTS